ncbi:hypothetical protein [Sphingorhabdus sp.]|uniref:hypothetical protein n=1 Tax=Sphingorhabdus sp. TaxID=1902408 RepID=UPI003341F35B
MASLPHTFGVEHVFGLYDTADFVTLQSDDISQKAALDVEVMDETGRVITDRLDDRRIETSISGVLLSTAAIPTIGAQLAYDSVNYIVKDVSDAGTNNGFRKVTLKLVKYQEIA